MATSAESSKENSNDSISRLPDSVLCHILSFLPTKYGVATSILSKRWQFLWTYALNLDFDDDDDMIRFRGARNTTFADIVDKVLSSRRRDCCIKRLRLENYEINWDVNRYDSWIYVAIERNVEEFDLLLGSGYNACYEIPSRLFYCTTLVVLKLACADIMLNVPSSVHLPSLKVLHLMSVQYKDNQSIGNLLNGCPFVEELLVERDYDDNIFNFEITAPSLKSLVLIFYGVFRGRMCKVQFKNLRNLVEAKINVYPYDLDDYKDSMDVLRGIYNAKFLELSESTMKALRYDTSDNFPVFHNLVRLELDGFCCFWSLLTKFLQNSPFLRHLTLAKRVAAMLPPDSCACRDSERWMQPQNVPMCLSSHLTTFCFDYGFVGLDDEIGFVRYILENSLVLENMTIRCWPKLDLKQKHVVRRKMKTFAKSSEKCRLKIR